MCIKSKPKLLEWDMEHLSLCPRHPIWLCPLDQTSQGELQKTCLKGECLMVVLRNWYWEGLQSALQHGLDAMRIDSFGMSVTSKSIASIKVPLKTGIRSSVN